MCCVKLSTKLVGRVRRKVMHTHKKARRRGEEGGEVEEEKEAKKRSKETRGIQHMHTRTYTRTRTTHERTQAHED